MLPPQVALGTLLNRGTTQVRHVPWLLRCGALAICKPTFATELLLLLLLLLRLLQSCLLYTSPSPRDS